MGFGPARTPTKSVARSPVRSLDLGVEGGVEPPESPEPYPIPDRQVYCLAAVQNENQATPGGTCGPAANPCPTDDPGALTGNWTSRYTTEPDTVLNRLVPDNFPVVNALDSFPAGCLSNWLGNFSYPDGTTIRTGRFDELGGGVGQTALNACSVGSLGQSALGRISLEMATARWTITQIDAVNNRIYVDRATYLLATGTGGFEPQVAVNGQNKNNGYWEIFQVNDVELWLEVKGSLEAEAATGQVSFQPAICTVCGSYTSVIDACQSIRIACDPAGVDKRMHFVFVDSAVYDPDPLPITGIGPDYIEVLSPFNGNDSGDWGAGFWGFNERGDRITGSFTAVSDPPNRFVAEVRNYTGFELDPAQPDDLLLLISNSIGYDGNQPVTPDNPFGTPLWRYDIQLYVGPSTGDWQNQATVLVDGFLLSSKPGRVTGTLGLYDGIYVFERAAPDNSGGVLPNTPFVGTDDGVVEFQGLSFIINGIPPGYNQTNATVIITGTGVYDGTYTGCHVFDTGFGPGIIQDGTLDDVWYQGDVLVGNWEVTSGTPASGTIQQSFGDAPNTFGSAKPEKSGTIPATDCLGIRVSVGPAHGINPGDSFEMFQNTVYTTLCFGTVDTVGADYVDLVFITFAGTDSGLWNATEP